MFLQSKKRSELPVVVCYSKTEAEGCEGRSSENVFLGSTCYTPAEHFTPVANSTIYKLGLRSSSFVDIILEQADKQQ